MGGNAFKNPPTVRMDSAEFYPFTDSVIDVLKSNTNKEFYRLLSYRDKPSHGDCDVLYYGVSADEIRDILTTQYSLTQDDFVKNSDVLSVRINNFQFDFINCKNKSQFESSKFYFNYNDFGNILGRFCHKLGIKLSNRGISIVVRHKERSDHILAEIFLTEDASISLDILGLDRETYNRGFDSLEDIFKFAASSKYFDPEIFSLEHRSATSRIRDKKRSTYNSLLRWVVSAKPEAKYSFAEKSELGGYSIRLPYYYTEVLPRFPWVDEKVQSLIADFELDLRFKEVYNGTIVSELTGLSGKELGAFMSTIRPQITHDVKVACINNPELVKSAIRSLFEMPKNLLKVVQNENH